jgi:tRNA-Thr(GGU) m(6)t(6)A37 methyltransferase TsaA
MNVEPIGLVASPRVAVEDDHWGGVVSTITLDERFGPDALQGLADFSHLEVVFVLHLVEKVETGLRHPRNNPAYPQVGIFAQRGRNRPNRLGLSICEIVAVEGRQVTVRGLDALDGTPVLDLKPVMREFLPRGEVRQPAWAAALMARYYD